MGARIRAGLFVLLAFGACWGGAVWTWRATNRMPSATDLVLFMLVLPLGVLACAWLIQRALNKPAAPSADAGVVAAPVAAPPSRLPVLAVLGAAVRTPHGDSPQELSAAIEAQSARPDLDPELVDDAGYPIMSVRAASAGDAAWRDEAQAWLAAQGHHQARFGDAHWRAIELASGVMTDLVDAAGALAAHAGAPLEAPLLRIVPLAPADWSAAQRTAAGAWLAHVAVAAGWNSARLTSSLPPPGEPLAAALSLMSLLVSQAATAAEPALSILVAFDSRIDQAVVDRMAADGSLLTTARPQGTIPGEGAAGLLLAEPAHAQQLGAEAAWLQAAGAARSSSADASGRADATDLRRLAARVLSETAVDAASIAVLVGDTDQRSNRVLELMALAHEDLPHLDAGIDVKATGLACGPCAAVPFLAALALAREHVQDGAAAVLCIANTDPIQRSVALVRPAGSATDSAT